MLPHLSTGQEQRSGAYSGGKSAWNNIYTKQSFHTHVKGPLFIKLEKSQNYFRDPVELLCLLQKKISEAKRKEKKIFLIHVPTTRTVDVITFIS